MALELYQPTEVRNITASATGVTGGYRIQVSGESTCNVYSYDSAESTAGSAVSGPVTSAFRLLGVLVKFSSARTSGVTVSHIADRGANWSGVSLAYSGTGATMSQWSYFPPGDMIIPENDTIRIDTRAAGVNTAVDTYINVIVGF